MKNDCLFCKIIAGEIPAKILFENDDLIVIEDINPQAPVHFLIIPKKHIPTTNDITMEDSEYICMVYIMAGKIAKKMNINTSGYRVVNNCNNDGGQTVFHIHFHLLGGREMRWPPG